MKYYIHLFVMLFLIGSVGLFYGCSSKKEEAGHAASEEKGAHAGEHEGEKESGDHAGEHNAEKETGGHAGEQAGEHNAEKETGEHAGEQAGEHEGEHEEAGHNEAASGQLISFSKQLQSDFKITSSPVQKREIHESIRSLGEIKAAGSREAEIVAPFAGTLLPDAERGIVRPGQRVSKGDHLAVIAPSTEQGGWDQLMGDYRLAKAEFDRVSRLRAEGAVPEKRIQEAQYDLLAKEARLRAALGGMEIDDLDSTGKLFQLHAPISGVLTDIHLRFGQHVEVGEHLFNIVDPSNVWLEAHVPASDAQKLEGIKDAYFCISGSETIYRTSDYNGHLVSIGGLLDPSTRRVPVIFEITNPNNMFKPGSFAQIFLRRGASKNALAIPKSAIVDEDGTPVAIIQVGPEDFRKAILEVGAQDGDYVEVITGLAEGDKVVTNGAYKVKIAALKTGGADAHAGHGH